MAAVVLDPWTILERALALVAFVELVKRSVQAIQERWPSKKTSGNALQRVFGETPPSLDLEFPNLLLLCPHHGNGRTVIRRKGTGKFSSILLHPSNKI